MATKSLGRYELIRRLAVGGMGEVFLARQRGVAGFDRLCVVKTLLPELAENPELVSLFVDEARITAHLSHPNIVHILDFGEEDGTFFLSMEYVAGQNLARIDKRAAREGLPLSRDRVVHIVAEVARGLEAAHSANDADGKPLNIVHRDVSPHNVLVSYRGDVKLMDFGIAKAQNKSQRTEAGVIRGKLGYMSPEQADGREVDARSDVFSAGIVLYELTTGRALFAGDNAAHTLQLVLSEPIAPPSELIADYPKNLEQIVMAALERNRDDRLGSAAELAAALRAHLTDTGAVVDKNELGDLVRRLFPVEVQGLSDEELSAGTSSDAITRVVEDGTASIAIERVEPSPADAGALGTRPATPSAARAVRSPDEPSKRGASGAVLMLGLAVAAAGFLGLRSLTAADDAQVEPSASAEPVTAARLSPRPSPADAAAKTVDAGGAPVAVREIDAASPAVAAKKRAAPRRRRRAVDQPRATATPARTPEKAPVATEPATRPPPSPGFLSGGSEPFAVFRVAGQRIRTPFRTKLSPGTYPVVAVVSGGGGQHSANVTIQSGKTTKCRVADGKLRCTAPR